MRMHPFSDERDLAMKVTWQIRFNNNSSQVSRLFSVSANYRAEYKPLVRTRQYPLEISRANCRANQVSSEAAQYVLINCFDF
jgi:nucleosome binding factor SPN SPT16 subunit